MAEPFWQNIIDRYYPEGSELRDKYMKHSRDVASFALELNAAFVNPIDTADVEAAAMLHDIGIFLTDAPSISCCGAEPYIRHGVLGAQILREEGVSEKFVRVCERHTGVGISHDEIRRNHLPLADDRIYSPRSRLEKLICYADKFYSKSGDGQRKTLAEVEKGMARFGKRNLERFGKLDAWIRSEMKNL